MHCAFRHRSRKGKNKLDDHKAVQLILRPDIEDRSFHHTTKAYTGPELKWPHAIKSESNSFIFTPDSDRILTARISDGVFISEPEWYYMIHRPYDKNRGMDGDSDLFSPGYFKVFMEGSDSAELTVESFSEKNPSDKKFLNPLSSAEREKKIKDKIACADDIVDPLSDLKQSLKSYVVKRGNYKSVIAGYPWFLDWGRDSLIFTRGLISAGLIEDSKAVLKQFGRFEQGGTLPNMIIGGDAGNRDTADAMLWFFVAVNDLISKEKSKAFLDELEKILSLDEVKDVDLEVVFDPPWDKDKMSKVKWYIGMR